MIDASEESLPELVSRAVDNAKEVVRAEAALAKAQAVAKVGGYRNPVILFAVAGLLALAALFGLIDGLILTLAPQVGPGWATVIVIGAVLALAGLLGWLGSRGLKQA